MKNLFKAVVILVTTLANLNLAFAAGYDSDKADWVSDDGPVSPLEKRRQDMSSNFSTYVNEAIGAEISRSIPSVYESTVASYFARYRHFVMILDNAHTEANWENATINVYESKMPSEQQIGILASAEKMRDELLRGHFNSEIRRLNPEASTEQLTKVQVLYLDIFAKLTVPLIKEVLRQMNSSRLHPERRMAMAREFEAIKQNLLMDPLAVLVHYANMYSAKIEFGSYQDPKKTAQIMDQQLKDLKASRNPRLIEFLKKYLPIVAETGFQEAIYDLSYLGSPYEVRQKMELLLAFVKPTTPAVPNPELAPAVVLRPAAMTTSNRYRSGSNLVCSELF